MATTASRSDLFAPMYFLDRSKTYDTIKPYNMLYYPKEDFPRHNLEHGPCSTRLQDMRACDKPPSLDVEGFEVRELPTQMVYGDFADDSKVESIYCRELEAHLKETLGANHVRALDYQIRKKAPDFPHHNGKLPPGPQPSIVVHADVTRAGAEKIIRELYGDVADRIMQSRYQVITVWRPRKLPIADWPLAVCSAPSVRSGDLVASDVLYPKYVAENYLVHHSPEQNWYWLPDHRDGEILLFKAVDTGMSGSWPCPHGAFPMPWQDSAASRESIDVRLLVMYADIDYPNVVT